MNAIVLEALLPPIGAAAVSPEDAYLAAPARQNPYLAGTPLRTQQDSRTIRSVCKTIRRGRELAFPDIRSRSS
jgi:hypothetical protein